MMEYETHENEHELSAYIYSPTYVFPLWHCIRHVMWLVDAGLVSTADKEEM